jgi:hypothetical protein
MTNSLKSGGADLLHACISCPNSLKSEEGKHIGGLYFMLSFSEEGKHIGGLYFMSTSNMREIIYYWFVFHVDFKYE